MLYTPKPDQEPTANLAHLRQEYAQAALDIADVATDPYKQFAAWFAQAQEAGPKEPNAMHLATADADGRPSGRIVLLKGFSVSEGFVFFTNYESRKGRQLHENPHASLTFFWPELERQVRVEGLIRPTSAAASDAYFASRPRGSQIGAVASPQSRTLASRAALEGYFRQIEAQYGDGPIPRPANWGGYALSPVLVEFWQGRPSRLHDRIAYELQDNGDWKLFRMAP